MYKIFDFSLSKSSVVSSTLCHSLLSHLIHMASQWQDTKVVITIYCYFYY